MADTRSEVCAEGRHSECQGHGPDGPCTCPDPTHELRTAAQLLRERAEALRAQAKPPQQPLMWFAEDLITGATITDGGVDLIDHKLTRAEAGWLALATPLLAEPMADQLDAVADQYAADHRFPVRGVACHCWTNDPMCRTALATARVVNGALS